MDLSPSTWCDFSAVLRKLRDRYAQTILAARVAGMLQPLRETVKTLAVEVTWPSIDKGLAWLEDQEILLGGRRATVEANAEALASRASSAANRLFDAKVAREVRESIRRGEGADSWHKRVSAIVDVERNVSETVHRTFAHRAYYAGQTEVLTEVPAVASRFPYVAYDATRDTRVRPTHWAKNKMVARVGSPLHKEMLKLLDEYNCRCSSTPMTLKQAQAAGIDDDTGAPPEPVETIADQPQPAAEPVGRDFVGGFGKSVADVRRTGSITTDGQLDHPSTVAWDRIVADAIGEGAGDADLASVAGVPDGESAEILIRQNREGPPSIKVKTDGRTGVVLDSEIVKNDAGETEISNDLFLVPKAKQGQGIGSRSFARQVEQAAEKGVARIRTLAAGSPDDADRNGYYTWARLGYDFEFDAELIARLPVKFRDARTLQQLMRLPDGPQWWRANGRSFDGVFDLARGSESRAALQRYLDVKGISS